MADGPEFPVFPVFLSADDFDTMHVADSGRLVPVVGLELNKADEDITIEAWAQRANTLGDPFDNSDDWVNIHSLGTLIKMSAHEAITLAQRIALIYGYELTEI